MASTEVHNPLFENEVNLELDIPAGNALSTEEDISNFLTIDEKFDSWMNEDLRGTPFSSASVDEEPQRSPTDEGYSFEESKPEKSHLESKKRNSPESSSHRSFSEIKYERSPSPTEDRQLKRQKRLIKNRESAQLSRLRKKVYVEELEKKVVLLQDENKLLLNTNSTLSKENQALRDEIFQLKKNNGVTTIFNKKLPNSKAAKTAGICLMIVLFSFGLFFNASPNRNIFEPAIEGIPEVVPQRTSAKGFGRSLNSVNEDESKQKETEKRSYVEVSNKEVSNDFVGKRTIKDDPDPLPNKRIKIENETTTLTHSHEEKETGELISVNEQHNIQAHQLSRQRPQTSYIYCPEAQHIIPASIRTEDGHPGVVALLVPSDILNITEPGQQSSLTEITCQVLEMNVLPVYPVANTSSSLQRTS